MKSENVLLMNECNSLRKEVSSLKYQYQNISDELAKSKSETEKAQLTVSGLRTEVNELRNQVSSMEEEIQKQNLVISCESTNSALQMQHSELKRLNDEVNRLIDEVHKKDRDLVTSLEANKRHEGENVGTKIALENMTHEYQLLRKEYDNLAHQASQYVLKIKDLESALDKIRNSSETVGYNSHIRNLHDIDDGNRDSRLAYYSLQQQLVLIYFK
jgi:predicted  nucleic acid-binding Zn-ribbon protein